jgi:hypothetical protein
MIHLLLLDQIYFPSLSFRNGGIFVLLKFINYFLNLMRLQQHYFGDFIVAPLDWVGWQCFVGLIFQVDG